MLNILCHALACFLFVSFALAQVPPNVFQWGFSNQFLSTSLPSCIQLPVSLILNSTSTAKPTPPFYMFAYEIDGVPQSQLIGNDSANLKWTVTHRPGAKLWLNVVDSAGVSGGIGPNVYTVTTNTVNSCLPPPSPKDFTVHSNITSGSSLDTCLPWGLRIKGGSPPYNITILETSSSIITNATLLGADDAFTYINRGDPGTTLLAAVSDLTGRWALGTPQVKVTGAPNPVCPGLNSLSGNASELDAADAIRNAAIAAAAKKKTSTIIGVVVTLILLLLIGVGIGLFFWRKRRTQFQQELGESKAIPYIGTPVDVEAQTAPGSIQVLSINSFLDSRSEPAATTTALRPALSVSTSSSGGSIANPFSSPHDYQSVVGGGSVLGGSVAESSLSSNSRPMSSSTASSGRNGFTSFPSQSIRRSAKAIEAGYSLEEPMPENRMLVRNASAAPSSISGMSRTNSGDVAVPSTPGTGEIVYQHQDGGTILRELPPPYVDRGNNGTQPEPVMASPTEVGPAT